MDKKQAYTWGAIIVVCFVSLLTLASFMGDADESSFDGFNTRGYDLAQMPFMNDEAEQYLLASKYPDMQGNNSTMLYSAGESKPARKKTPRPRRQRRKISPKRGKTRPIMHPAAPMAATAAGIAVGGLPRGRLQSVNWIMPP